MGARYVSGVGGITAAALGVAGVLGAPERAPLIVALALAIGVQGPLGWWLVRSLGTDRFMMVWGVGLGARLLVLGIAAWVVVPGLKMGAAPVLVPLALLLVTLLALEGVVLLGRDTAGEMR